MAFFFNSISILFTTHTIFIHEEKTFIVSKTKVLCVLELSSPQKRPWVLCVLPSRSATLPSPFSLSLLPILRHHCSVLLSFVEKDFHLGSKVRRGLVSAGCQETSAERPRRPSDDMRPRGFPASTRPSHDPPRLPTLQRSRSHRCTRKKELIFRAPLYPCPVLKLQDFFYYCWNKMVMGGGLVT